MTEARPRTLTDDLARLAIRSSGAGSLVVLAVLVGVLYLAAIDPQFARRLSKGLKAHRAAFGGALSSSVIRSGERVRDGE